MNTKFVKTRKFVRDNRTYLAFCAGSVVTSAAIIFLTKDDVLLKVTKDQLELLKQGGGVAYELKDQTLTLVNIPAVEAFKASL